MKFFFPFILILVLIKSNLLLGSELEIAIKKSDFEKILSLISTNCSIDKINKQYYLKLAKTQTDKRLSSNRRFSEIIRLAKACFLIGFGSYFGSKACKERIKLDAENKWALASIGINCLIIINGFEDISKFIGSYDLKISRNRALAVEALIENMSIIKNI